MAPLTHTAIWTSLARVRGRGFSYTLGRHPRFVRGGAFICADRPCRGWGWAGDAVTLVLRCVLITVLAAPSKPLSVFSLGAWERKDALCALSFASSGDENQVCFSRAPYAARWGWGAVKTKVDHKRHLYTNIQVGVGYCICRCRACPSVTFVFYLTGLGTPRLLCNKVLATPAHRRCGGVQ